MWAASCTTCKAAGVSTRDRPVRPTWDGGGPVVRTTTWKRSARPAFHHNYHSYKTDSEATIAAVTLQLAHSFELLDIASLGEHCHRKACDIDPKHRTLSDEQDQFSRKKKSRTRHHHLGLPHWSGSAVVLSCTSHGEECVSGLCGRAMVDFMQASRDRFDVAVLSKKERENAKTKYSFCRGLKFQIYPDHSPRSRALGQGVRMIIPIHRHARSLVWSLTPRLPSGSPRREGTWKPRGREPPQSPALFPQQAVVPKYTRSCTCTQQTTPVRTFLSSHWACRSHLALSNPATHLIFLMSDKAAQQQRRSIRAMRHSCQ